MQIFMARKMLRIKSKLVIFNKSSDIFIKRNSEWKMKVEKKI